MGFWGNTSKVMLRQLAFLGSISNIYLLDRSGQNNVFRKLLSIIKVCLIQWNVIVLLAHTGYMAFLKNMHLIPSNYFCASFSLEKKHTEALCLWTQFANLLCTCALGVSFQRHIWAPAMQDTSLHNGAWRNRTPSLSLRQFSHFRSAWGFIWWKQAFEKIITFYLFTF